MATELRSAGLSGEEPAAGPSNDELHVRVAAVNGLSGLLRLSMRALRHHVTMLPLIANIGAG